MKTFEQNGLWTFMPVSAQVAPIKCVKSLACNLHSLGVAHYPYQSKGSSIATPIALVRATGHDILASRGASCTKKFSRSTCLQLAQLRRDPLPVPNHKGIALLSPYGLVRATGLEPALTGNRILNPTRLPIPPCPQTGYRSKHET